MVGINSFIVAPRSKVAIDHRVKEYLSSIIPIHLTAPSILNVEELLDVHIPRTHGFKVELCENIGPDIEGITLPLEKKMKFTTREFERIVLHVPRSLFTGAHEAYHVIDHAAQMRSWDADDWINSIALHRKKMPIYYDPEWQANYGAGALLMPKNTLEPFISILVKRKATSEDIYYEITKAYGVSSDAARVRVSALDIVLAKNPKVGTP